jgi:hypothetical protein
MLVKRGDLDTRVSFRITGYEMDEVVKYADQSDVTISSAFRRLVKVGLAYERRSYPILHRDRNAM